MYKRFIVLSLLIYLSGASNLARENIIFRMLRAVNQSRKHSAEIKETIGNWKYLLDPMLAKIMIKSEYQQRPIGIVGAVVDHRLKAESTKVKELVQSFTDKWFNGDIFPFHQLDPTLNKNSHIKVDLSLMIPVFDKFFPQQKLDELQAPLYEVSIEYLSNGGKPYWAGFEIYYEDQERLKCFYQTHKAFLQFLLVASKYYDGHFNFISGYKTTQMKSHIKESKRKVLKICQSYRGDKRLLAAGFTLLMNLDRIISQDFYNTIEYFKELIPDLVC